VESEGWFGVARVFDGGSRGTSDIRAASSSRTSERRTFMAAMRSCLLNGFAVVFASASVATARMAKSTLDPGIATRRDVAGLPDAPRVVNAEDKVLRPRHPTPLRTTRRVVIIVAIAKLGNVVEDAACRVLWCCLRASRTLNLGASPNFSLRRFVKFTGSGHVQSFCPRTESVRSRVAENR